MLKQILLFIAVSVAAIPVHTQTPTGFKFKPDALECLAQNIYYETSASSLADAMAVSDVVLNRVIDSRWPNTVCEVIKDASLHGSGDPIKHKCQFSWFCDGKPDQPKDKQKWGQSLIYAHMFLTKKAYWGLTEGSTHYHAFYVRPSWSKKFKQVVRIGSHYFYRG
jgi:N-acetylmuramoyl-L-alanine amidase